MAKTKIKKYLIFILVLGFLLRLVNLGQSFWLDEASQAQMSSWPVSRIWSGRQNDFHPPLYYLLAHFWMSAGSSEIWLRLPSVLFGVANIYLIFIFARKLFPDTRIRISRWSFGVEYLAAVLLAANPYHIYYSQEFRSYSLLCLLGTWSMYLLYTGRWFWLTAANTLLLYTHYSSLFLIMTQLAFLAVYQRDRLQKFFYSLIFSFVLYIPWLPRLIGQLQSGINIDSYFPGWRQVLSLPMFKILPLTFFKLVAGRISFLSAPIYLTYVVFVLGVTFFAFRLSAEKRTLLFTWVLLPIFLMMAVSFVFPQNQPFRVIYILPALMLVFAGAAARYPKLLITLFVYIMLVGNLAYFTRPRLQREQWRQAVSFIRQNRDSSTVTVVKFTGRFSPLVWYGPELPVIAAVGHIPARPEEVAARLQLLTSPAVSRVFLFDYLGDLTDPHEEINLALDNLGFVHDRTWDFPGVGFIHLFQRI